MAVGRSAQTWLSEYHGVGQAAGQGVRGSYSRGIRDRTGGSSIYSRSSTGSTGSGVEASGGFRGEGQGGSFGRAGQLQQAVVLLFGSAGAAAPADKPALERDPQLQVCAIDETRDCFIVVDH